MDLIDLLNKIAVKKKKGGFIASSDKAHTPVVIMEYSTGNRIPITEVVFNANEILLVGGSREKH